MKLSDYLYFNKITCESMSKQLGVGANYIRTIKRGKAIPSLELAEKIEILTGGEVTVKELRG